MPMAKEAEKSADKILTIEYRGPAKRDAELLAQSIRTGGVPVGEPVAATDDKATMAIGEIVVTIIASAAARALLEVTMTHLRDYLVSRIERESGKSDAPNVQVLVAKETGGTAAKKLISLRVATAEFVTKFIKEVGDEVVRTVA